MSKTAIKALYYRKANMVADNLIARDLPSLEATSTSRDYM
jgi:hypothetical protein